MLNPSLIHRRFAVFHRSARFWSFHSHGAPVRQTLPQSIDNPSKKYAKPSNRILNLDESSDQPRGAAVAEIVEQPSDRPMPDGAPYSSTYRQPILPNHQHCRSEFTDKSRPIHRLTEPGMPMIIHRQSTDLSTLIHRSARQPTDQTSLNNRQMRLRNRPIIVRQIRGIVRTAGSFTTSNMPKNRKLIVKSFGVIVNSHVRQQTLNQPIIVRQIRGIVRFLDQSITVSLNMVTGT